MQKTRGTHHHAAGNEQQSLPACAASANQSHRGDGREDRAGARGSARVRTTAPSHMLCSDTAVKEEGRRKRVFACECERVCP